MQHTELEKFRGILPHTDILSQCMHCGLCLSVCPTYEITKSEKSSPRGRIRLIKSVAEGRLKAGPAFRDEMEFCLDCQACQTACPAGVQYGKMVEGARDYLTAVLPGKGVSDILKKIGLNYILANPRALKLFSKVVRWLQLSGLPEILRRRKSLKKIFGNSLEYPALLPQFSAKPSSDILPVISAPYVKKKLKIAFLTGCLMDTAFAEVNLSTVEMLQKLGCEVIIPENQVCCGSLHAHNGESAKAKELAEKNLSSFSKYDYDYLVSNSAGCGAFMKEYAHLFEDDESLKNIAAAFSDKVLDVSEFLCLPDINPSFGTVEERITYHDACHLCHTQKITAQPRELISKIPGADYTPLAESTWCCGSAGIYNVLRYDDSMKFLERKMKRIEETGAEIVITGNPGCFLQLKYGIEKTGIDCRVEHTASFFNRLINNQSK